MPAIAEETEQERLERIAREEEEARLIAAQEAAQQIPDAMTAPELMPSTPIMPPESVQWATPVNTFTGPDLEALRRSNPSAAAQYDEQVAAARRNNGFINADVSAEGRVLSPMISPELSPQAAAIAEMRARQFSGQQKYRKLIEGGATPEEAYRASAFDLHAGNPTALARGLRDVGAMRRVSPEPVLKTINGRQFYQTPTGGWAPLSVKTERLQGGHVPPAAHAAEDNLKEEISVLRRQLAPRRMDELPLNPAEADALKAKIAEKEQQRVQLMSDPSYNPNIDQGPGGWPAMRDRFNATAPQRPAEAPVAETFKETVVVVKDGRRYSLPKSQLKEALKAGYKVGQ